MLRQTSTLLFVVAGAAAPLFAACSDAARKAPTDTPAVTSGATTTSTTTTATTTSSGEAVSATVAAVTGAGGFGGFGGGGASSGGMGGAMAGGGLALGWMVTDFALLDVNAASLSYNTSVSPKDHLKKVSGWYFGHAT